MIQQILIILSIFITIGAMVLIIVKNTVKIKSSPLTSPLINDDVKEEEQMKEYFTIDEYNTLKPLLDETNLNLNNLNTINDCEEFEKIVEPNPPTSSTNLYYNNIYKNYIDKNKSLNQKDLLRRETPFKYNSSMINKKANFSVKNLN